MVGSGGYHVEAQGPVGFGQARVGSHVAQRLAVGAPSGGDASLGLVEARFDPGEGCGQTPSLVAVG